MHGIFIRKNLAEKIRQGEGIVEIEGEGEKNKKTIHDQSFIRYVLKSDEKDLGFTEQGILMALKQSIGEELDIAREHVLNQRQYQEKSELGLDYDRKNQRIRAYITYYQKMLAEGKMVGYDAQTREAEIDRIFNRVILGNQSKYYMNMQTRVASVMAGKYIASLNDSEFMTLLKDMEIVTPEQIASLTRKYRDIEDLRGEAYIQSNWKSISEAQQIGGEKQEEK